MALYREMKPWPVTTFLSARRPGQSRSPQSFHASSRSRYLPPGCKALPSPGRPAPPPGHGSVSVPRGSTSRISFLHRMKSRYRMMPGAQFLGLQGPEGPAVFSFHLPVPVVGAPSSV